MKSSEVFVVISVVIFTFLVILGLHLDRVYGTADPLSAICINEYNTCLKEHHVDCTYEMLTKIGTCTTTELTPEPPFVPVTRPFNFNEFNRTCECRIWLQ